MGCRLAAPYFHRIAIEVVVVLVVIINFDCCCTCTDVVGEADSVVVVGWRGGTTDWGVIGAEGPHHDGRPGLHS